MLPNGSIVGIKAAFENKEYRTYLEKTADGILNGKSSITVGELSKTSIFGDKQFRYIQALLGKQNIMTVATFDEGGVSNGLNQANGVMNDLTLSRNELIVLIMTTDAELVRTSDGKDFEFDGERTSAEYGGLKQMTKDDLKQIYELTKQHMPADIKNKNIDMSQKKPMGLNSYNENEIEFEDIKVEVNIGASNCTIEGQFNFYEAQKLAREALDSTNNQDRIVIYGAK